MTDPDPDNIRAVRAYEKAGFEKVRLVDTPDGRALFDGTQRMTDFSPREIVSELDRFVVGQPNAKRAVAIACATTGAGCSWTSGCTKKCSRRTS